MQPKLDIIGAKLGDFLTSDDLAETTYMHLPTTSTPIMLDSNTMIASSQSQSSVQKVGFVYLNEGQNLLIVFTNENSQGTNEAIADIHLTIKYSETKF